MVEPKTHSNPWHLNPHKTITNTIECWSSISTPSPFLYINLTKQLVLKNHSYHHQAPFSLWSAKSSSPSGSRAGSDLFMTERALSRKGLKAISIACHLNARALNATTACSWKLEREKKNDFWGGKLVAMQSLPQTAVFCEGRGVCEGRGEGGLC